jgi:hypothetical protein
MKMKIWYILLRCTSLHGMEHLHKVC